MSPSPRTSSHLSSHITSNLPTTPPSFSEPASTELCPSSPPHCAKPILNGLPDYVAPETAGPNNTYMPTSSTLGVTPEGQNHYPNQKIHSPAYMLKVRGLGALYTASRLTSQGSTCARH